MPSSQRPFFLSSFLAAFRQQAPPNLSAASSQANKHPTPSSSSSSPSTSPSATSSSPPNPTSARSISSTSHSHSQSTSTTSTSATSPPPPSQRTGSVMSQLPLHSPRGRPPIPIPSGGAGGGRRRGSDSSSEGFREVLGAEKWYVGGRTAAGEEKFFKLGVVKRIRSQDRLSLDRLSL